MNTFDAGILHFFNQYAQHSRVFDGVIATMDAEPLLKGWIVVAMFWWAWFDRAPDNTVHREIIIATIVGAIAAVAVSRLLAHFLPFRLRPLQTPGLGFVLPYYVKADTLRTWSSFPSDHAMVFFSMSTGLWYVSKTLGAWSTAFVALFIALPRIYLGYHYPTDIIAGAAIGILFANVANIAAVRQWLANPPLRWLQMHPASFYTTFLLFSQGLATLFEGLRHLGSVVFSR